MPVKKELYCVGVNDNGETKWLNIDTLVSNYHVFLLTDRIHTCYNTFDEAEQAVKLCKFRNKFKGCTFSIFRFITSHGRPCLEDEHDIVSVQ